MLQRYIDQAPQVFEELQREGKSVKGRHVPKEKVNLKYQQSSIIYPDLVLPENLYERLDYRLATKTISFLLYGQITENTGTRVRPKKSKTYAKYYTKESRLEIKLTKEEVKEYIRVYTNSLDSVKSVRVITQDQLPLRRFVELYPTIELPIGVSVYIAKQLRRTYLSLVLDLYRTPLQQDIKTPNKRRVCKSFATCSAENCDELIPVSYNSIHEVIFDLKEMLKVRREYTPNLPVEWYQFKVNGEIIAV